MVSDLGSGPLIVAFGQSGQVHPNLVNLIGKRHRIERLWEDGDGMNVGQPVQVFLSCVCGKKDHGSRPLKFDDKTDK